MTIRQAAADVRLIVAQAADEVIQNARAIRPGFQTCADVKLVTAPLLESARVEVRFAHRRRHAPRDARFSRGA